MRLFRKRYLPEEIIELDDEIIFHDNDILVTKWKAIRPKPDLSHGTSCFFLKQGIKISKCYRADGSLIYWYCDIGDCHTDNNLEEFVFIDLLADVIIYPDRKVRVVDLAEVADVYENNKIDSISICKMLRRLDYLLESINDGTFKNMQDTLEKYE